MDTILTEPQRQQLDGIVHQMTQNGEPDHAIQFVVSDFKQKYGSSQNNQPQEPGLLSNIGNALISSEQGLGQSAAQALYLKTGGAKQITDITQENMATGDSLFNLAKQTTDQTRKVKLLDLSTKAYQDAGMTQENIIGKIKSNSQILGDAAGVVLDTLLAGSYGEAKSGAKFLPEVGNLLGKTGELTKGVKVVTPIVKQALGQTLKDIGTKTAVRSATGGGIGYVYDVAGNLQQGKTGTEALTPGLGTGLGFTIPLAIGGIQAVTALTKSTAPRFINSLIKPKQADFSYGKDPGRTVSEMGITGNNINDFTNNIDKARQDVGSQIGEIYSNSANANIKINANSEIAKLDEAITTAAKGGKENQGIVTALQNIKDALLYEHGIDAEGNIVKIGNQARDLSALSPQEAFDLKKAVAEHTRFTGKPTDDKTVNSVLKNIYGGLKEALNKAVGKNNPEITNLNQKYADLTSAELATRNRSAILGRADLISAPIKVGTVAGVIASLGSGVGVIPILTGISVGLLDKALESTAVKTRIAAWLGNESPSVIQKVLAQNPAIATSLYRTFPKLISQTR